MKATFIINPSYFADGIWYHFSISILFHIISKNTSYIKTFHFSFSNSLFDFMSLDITNSFLSFFDIYIKSAVIYFISYLNAVNLILNYLENNS